MTAESGVPELYLETFGNPDGKPLVWLHGFMGSHLDWYTSLLPHFEDCYNVCPDLPGHGKSLFSTQISFHQVVDRLVQELQEQGLTNFTIIGYSMGGRLGFHLLDRFPQQVQALIGISTAPGLRTHIEQTRRGAADRALMDRLDQIGLPDFLEAWYQLSLFKRLVDFPELRRQLLQSRQHNDPQQLRWALESMGNGVTPLLWDHLPQLSVPVLLITGADDLKYSRLSRELSRQLPKSQKAVIPQADHAVHLEKPLETAVILKHFLSELS